jgi:hypothetical protein
VLEHTIDVLEDLALLIFERIGHRLGNVTDGKNGGRCSRGGSEPQPEDAQVGGWSRQRLEEMDGRFCARLTHAFERGDENKEAAAATISARQR